MVATGNGPRRSGATPSNESRISWNECLRQPREWYGGEEAARIGRNVLLFQRQCGGWDKNIDMARPLTNRERRQIEETQQEAATIDNGATYTQLAFLARLIDGGGTPNFEAGFTRGLDYLLAAQYPNGGWPQYYPLRKGYYSHITFNDDAMIGVLTLLRQVAAGNPPYAFVDKDRRARCSRAVESGIRCILACQIEVRGKKTAWCAQHDERTLTPAPARIYEKASLSGSESVEIVRFLMRIPDPGPEVSEAVESAVAWLRQVQLRGIRIQRTSDPALPGGQDTVVVEDPAAPALWARFYELGTNRPIFCGKDGVVKYTLAEIEHERRNGYAWYSRGAEKLLDEEYPRWQAGLRRPRVR